MQPCRQYLLRNSKKTTPESKPLGLTIQDTIQGSAFSPLKKSDRLQLGLFPDLCVANSSMNQLASLRHSGFSVHSTRTPADPKDPAFFNMLRYMAKPTVALSIMSFDPKNEKVVYRAIFNAMLGTERIEILRHLAKKNRARPEGHPAA